MDNTMKAYVYSFWEGDKGIVFSASEKGAHYSVMEVYGSEYSMNHNLKLTVANYMGNGIFCTEDTWK